MNTFGPLVDSGWLAAHLGDPRLRVIDFRWQVGQPGPTDPRAGHIPGAFSAPWGGNLDRAGRFKPADELRRRFRDLGVRDGSQVVAYCGSGVSACVNLLALERAGLAGGRLYPGSWSDWSSRPEAPVATADETPRPLR